jgi:hypothetical protein
MAITIRSLVFGVASGVVAGAVGALLLWALNADSKWLLTGSMTAVVLALLNTIWPPKAFHKLLGR